MLTPIGCPGGFPSDHVVGAEYSFHPVGPPHHRQACGGHGCRVTALDGSVGALDLNGERIDVTDRRVRSHELDHGSDCGRVKQRHSIVSVVDENDPSARNHTGAMSGDDADTLRFLFVLSLGVLLFMLGPTTVFRTGRLPSLLRAPLAFAVVIAVGTALLAYDLIDTKPLP